MLHKLVLLGEGSVGKTCLAVQFYRNAFVENYDPTIEDCYRKQAVVEGQGCMLEVLDTAGQEEYTSLRDQWIKDGEGFAIVYAVDSQLSFDAIPKLKQQIDRVKESHPLMRKSHGKAAGQSAALLSNSIRQSSGSLTGHIPVILIGNKSDLAPNSHIITTQHAQAIAKRLGISFVAETSAKTGENVEAAFMELARLIHRSKVKQSKSCILL